MGPSSESKRDIVQPPHIEAHHLADDGTFPNNETLPLVVYHGALDVPERDAAQAVEKLVRTNGWGGTWRNGIYSYHHYHSTAHEALIVVKGTARVQLGGSEGVTVEVQPGDALVLPAGVAHKNLGSSADFLIVGAYPEGQDWDMNYGKPGERPQADENIANVPLPTADPLYGADGPLMDQWGAA